MLYLHIAGAAGFLYLNRKNSEFEIMLAIVVLYYLFTILSGQTIRSVWSSPMEYISTEWAARIS